ncbi:hypothetical protein P280DRAFT_553788 [Massarina eburnea CBS 473.64]|uniref:Rhodopsin domain-containing protein n=1 Tax=Massarina eburnea CBS 473.64 TaxID=1395130 RepID=A0A6A6RJE4_9PLEO|nr:hypothetical protein P280DRAFT_553788 [Massarina eburnea CBS 473.64]
MSNHVASPISPKEFQVTIWTLSAFAALFLASRFAVRISIKRKLMENDYFLVAALPCLFIACGLLPSILGLLSQNPDASPDPNHDFQSQFPGATPRLVATIELLWIVIFFVKFSFLFQFKFYKPPYAYVNVHLTRYYWMTIGVSCAAFLFTIVYPIVLCPNPGNCRYINQTNTASWEIAVAVLNIMTDLLVISIPTLLVRMANINRSHAIINCTFKSLSVFAIFVAVTRLVLQFNATGSGVNYFIFTFLLAIEAAVAIIIASISSYRVVLLNYLTGRRTKKGPNTTKLQTRNEWRTQSDPREAPHSSGTGHGSLDDLPILAPIAGATRIYAA